MLAQVWIKVYRSFLFKAAALFCQVKPQNSIAIFLVSINCVLFIKGPIQSFLELKFPVDFVSLAQAPMLLCILSLGGLKCTLSLVKCKVNFK